eukprot:GFYU01006937.1.p1 GENE.GFYU01006937.1~~GFYU01006937.1.p1  ORF type:complete len:347 (-),score=84.84 GFYU01006937.1:932-1972(-)
MTSEVSTLAKAYSFRSNRSGPQKSEREAKEQGEHSQAQLRAAHDDAILTKKIEGYKEKVAERHYRYREKMLKTKVFLHWRKAAILRIVTRETNMEALAIVLKAWNRRPMHRSMAHWQWWTKVQRKRRQNPIERALEGQNEFGPADEQAKQMAQLYHENKIDFDEQEYLYLQTICLAHKMKVSMDGIVCNVRADELYVALKLRNVPVNTWPEYVPKTLDKLGTRDEKEARRQNDLASLMRDMRKNLKPNKMVQRVERMGQTMAQKLAEIDFLPPLPEPDPYEVAERKQRAIQEAEEASLHSHATGTATGARPGHGRHGRAHPPAGGASRRDESQRSVQPPPLNLPRK